MNDIDSVTRTGQECFLHDWQARTDLYYVWLGRQFKKKSLFGCVYFKCKFQNKLVPTI